ncbi:lipid IV(A) 3-deoxy-D-manno-octulosonic acid transferase [Thiotrichales bacterium 19S9-12]|nr:lipid IV(A) 3-deoxy-D-manno-octulosonic acid transferase [Thiotrichales bacterium 19S9-11]MCF6811351.1 lipid IV(A) 3-deoxy-D-manno-octulosonic acid transferase [Thiotrichales bacterium 19S9-12]
MKAIYLIMLIFYNIGMIAALPFILLKNIWRSRVSPGYRKRTLERLGLAPFHLSNCIWIHSVSMGETLAIAPLVKKLIQAHPEKSFLITTMSVTGSQQVKKIYDDFPQVKHCYLPYDISLSYWIFLKRTKPALLVIMETELWPNLINACSSRNIPIVLTNARLSEKSANGYQKVAWVTRIMLNQLSAIAAQNDIDGNRFLSLGLQEEKLLITGNIKFDIQITEDAQKKGINLKKSFNNRLAWIAASTHPGEDEIILRAHQKIISKYPNTLLILVPRHPERFDPVYELASSKFTTARRSLNQPVNDKTQVYLCDTMGEMMLLLKASDIAFIGGSLINRGGHNTLEPASLKLPVLSGPNTFNFAKINQSLIESNGLITVTDELSLYAKIIELIKEPELRQSIGENAYQVVQSNQGALEKQFSLINLIIQK